MKRPMLASASSPCAVRHQRLELRVQRRERRLLQPFDRRAIQPIALLAALPDAKAPFAAAQQPQQAVRLRLEIDDARRGADRGDV
jgi:hypothetical protein